MPDPRSIDQLAVADRLGRLMVAADLEGIDPAPLLRAAAGLGGDVRDELYAGVDHRFTSLGLQAHWPAEPADVAGFLAQHRAAFPAQHDRLGPLRSRASRAYLVEWQTTRGDAGLGCMLSSIGPRPIQEDAARTAAAVGLSEAAGVRLVELARTLAGERSLCDAYSDVSPTAGDPRIELRFVCKNQRPAETAQIIRAVGEVGRALGIAEAQLHFFAQSHPILASIRPVVLGIATAGGELAPRLTAEYATLPWETALRVVDGMYPEARSGKRLGQLAGATGGVDTLLRIQLGPAGLPDLQVWTRLGGPEPLQVPKTRNDPAGLKTRIRGGRFPRSLP